MNLQPLYKEVNEQKPKHRPTSAHAGLWYDKFCDRWGVPIRKWHLEKWKLGPKKKEWIDTVTGPIGDPHLIQEMRERMIKLIDKQSGRLFFAKTESRFVTGLGQGNPVENGFLWHHLLGTPYLPASSVKGLVRDWTEQWLKLSEEDVNRIFGKKGEDGKSSIGTVLFFDALPYRPVTLEADIITPHFSEYYQDPKKNKPIDGYNPVPIPFLTVAKGQPFLFGIAPRTSDENHKKDMNSVFEWLQEALFWVGGGAKTAIGYGRFVEDHVATNAYNKEKKREEEKEERLKQEKRYQEKLAKLTPIQRQMIVDGYEEDPERFMRAINTTWLPRMDSEQTSPEDQLEIAKLLATWYQTKKPEQWKKPNKKNKEKLKRIRAILEKGK